MTNVFSKCGFNCSRCFIYRENVQTAEDRQRGSDALKKYYGYFIPPENLYCDGCQAPDSENPVILNPKCTVRQCAVENGGETCAHCSEYYTCMHDEQIYNPDVSREKIEASTGAPMPDKDYIDFVEPFENLKHLDDIRRSLDPKDIVQVEKMSPVSPRIVDFPDLHLSEKEISAFKALHKVLKALKSIHGDTYAQRVVLSARRQHLLKIVWAFGLSGELTDNALVLDSEPYLAQKIHSRYARIMTYFEALERYGVHCEHVPLEEKSGEKGWITPTGLLKKKGWYMKMTFDSTTGGVLTLRALQTYAKTLHKKYGKKAFRYFSNVDMRCLRGD